MTEILLEKKLGGLHPASDDAYRVLGTIKAGTTLVADVRSPARRSNAQHAYWFALANTLFESQELYKVFEDFRACLLIRLGYCNRYPQRDGSMVPVAKSLKFSKMSADEFTRLVDDTLTFAEEMGFNREALLAATQERAA